MKIKTAVIALICLLAMKQPLIAKASSDRVNAASPAPTSGMMSLDAVSGASEKRANPRQVNLNQLREDLEKRKNGSSITTGEQSLLSLVSIAQLVFDLKEFATWGNVGSGAVLPENVSIFQRDLISSIHKQIESQKFWEKKLTLDQENTMKRFATHVHFDQNDDAYVVSWFEYLNGKKGLALERIKKSFDEDYNRAMKMTAIGFDRHNPLSAAQEKFKVIQTLASKEETEVFSDKLRKIKTHISKLPDHRAMT